ncbi:hypothetical protein [Streptomyces sp. SPB162]|uniref:hypothetical protein n=1 Tax=Streptomyces sp. SPB162 TaxID=2940560 RepID=UPI0024067B4E|nr:hypothetical protein [Streptomyces sp. SPB162]MDF9816022.1 hypothetical protein [Streptomyces sp. SPB162]
MPLPFLASDSVHDQREASAALPHTLQDRWMRPYRPGPWRVATAALLLVLSSYVLFAAMIIAATGALPGAGLCLAGGVLVILCALRLLRMGFWVSGRGLRQAGLLYTITVPWDGVGGVRTVQQPVKVLGLPRTVQGQALVVTRRDGQELRPLMTDHNADFLGRTEAFDMAADAIEGWATELR